MMFEVKKIVFVFPWLYVWAKGAESSKRQMKGRAGARGKQCLL